MISSELLCSRRALLGILLGPVAIAHGGACAAPAGAMRVTLPGRGGELADLELHEAAFLLRKKKVSPVELTRTCLERIERLDPILNAFISVTAERALAQAREAESEQQRGAWRGPLHGIPVALKDMIDTAGVVTTAGSAVFRDRVPLADAAVVERLRAHGAIILGKLNMYEVAFGPTTRATSFFGSVRNPRDTERIAGGSSSGSAAAVAGRLCYAALGSDTGGSIRQPAAFCGVVGLMPSYGRVSTRGALPLSMSADHLGPLTRSTLDAAYVLQVIAGHDAEEITSYDMPVDDFVADLRRRPASATRVGVARNHFQDDLDPAVRQGFDQAVATFTTLGAEIREVTVPVSLDRTVIQAEAYAYHSAHIAKTPELYLPETLAKLRLGSAIDMQTYMKARLSLDRLRRTATKIFSAVDVLLTPTTPVLPPKASDLPTAFEDVMANDAVMWRNTRPFNLLAFPTISLPCGLTQTGLPIGVQLSAAPWKEATLLRVAYAFEQATNWKHLLRSTDRIGSF